MLNREFAVGQADRAYVGDISYIWKSSESLLHQTPGLHKVAFTINYTPAESDRLRTFANPAAEAYAVTKRGLGKTAIYMVLVLEETPSTTTSKVDIHAHGYVLTSKNNSAKYIARRLRTAANTGGKINVVRGVNCADTYNRADRITVGWCHYCSKDLNRSYRIGHRNSPRLAASQPLRKAARIFNDNAMAEFRESQQSEKLASDLGALIDSMLIGRKAANDDHRIGKNKSA